jgi:hypothetical protein
VRFIKNVCISGVVALLAACTSSPMPPDPSVVVRSSPAATAGESSRAGLARNWDDYRLQAARRITQTSPGETYSGEVPEPLQSIPVLQVHLNRDGSIKRIEVLRTPTNKPETIEMAMRAIRRAAPFGSVGHLPQPWQFNETFLYDYDFKFQLRSLAENDG